MRPWNAFQDFVPKDYYNKIKADRLSEAGLNPPGWRRHMGQKTYFLVCSAIFFVVATAHLSRLIMGWETAIGGWGVPRWVSIPGFVIPGILSAWVFVLASRTRPAE